MKFYYIRELEQFIGDLRDHAEALTEKIYKACKISVSSPHSHPIYDGAVLIHQWSLELMLTLMAIDHTLDGIDVLQAKGSFEYTIPAGITMNCGTMGLAK